MTPVADGIETKNYALKDLPIPPLQFSLNGTIEHANTSALTLLGCSNLKGRSLSEIFDGHSVLVEDWIEKVNNDIRLLMQNSYAPKVRRQRPLFKWP